MNKRLKLDIQKFAPIYISTHSSYYQGSGTNTPAEVGDCRPYFTFYYEQNSQGQTTYTMNVYAQVNVRSQVIIPNEVYSYNISCSIAGQTFSRSGAYNSGNGGTIYLFSVQKTVNSNPDGSGIQINYSIFGDVSSGSFPSRGSANYSFTPPTVPLGATLNSISNFNVGENIVIGANINNPNFTHTLNIKIGDVVVATRNITTASTTISFTEEELNNIYNAMNLNSATFTFELTTKNGDTQIGVSSTRTATGTLTDVKPVIDSFEVSLNNPVSANNNIIKGVTNANFTIYVTTKKNATISKLTINNINTKVVDEGDGIYKATLSITKATTNVFNLEVVDSRGNVATDKKEFKLINYVSLSVGATLTRKSSTSGEINVDYSGNYWSGNFGGEDNTLNVSWKYREKGSSDWIDGTELTPTIDNTNMKFYQYTNLNTELGVDDEFFDYQKDWEIQIICVDKITQVIAQYTIVKGIGILELYKTIALVNGDLEVNGNAKINKELCVGNIESKNIFDGILENGSINSQTGMNDNSTQLLTIRLRSVNYIEVENLNNVISVRETDLSTYVYCYDKNKKFLGLCVYAWSNIPFTFKTIENTAYIRFVLRKGDGTINLAITDVNDVQIEKGSNATEYSKFKKYGYNENESMGSIVVDDIKCKNLLIAPYTENNKLTNTATKDDFYKITDMYCYLEEGKTYTFSCETDGEWEAGSGSDTVEAFLLKDKSYDTFIGIRTNPYTFTPTVSGNYYIRYDINMNGATHSFWNFQIEEGNVATKYIEHKEFSNKQIYSTNEQVIGTWIDGKPLYRKTLYFTNSGTIEQKATISTNIDEGVDIKGYLLANDKTKYLINSIYYVNASTFPQIRGVFNSSQQVQLNMDNTFVNATTYPTFVITAEYTKTTDTATTQVNAISLASLEEI